MRTRSAGRPQVIGVDGTYEITGTHILGFLPKTNGTISAAGRNSEGTGAETFLDAIPVVAGVYVDIPLSAEVPGFTVTLGGGASGTLFV